MKYFVSNENEREYQHNLSQSLLISPTFLTMKTGMFLRDERWNECFNSSGMMYIYLLVIMLCSISHGTTPMQTQAQADKMKTFDLYACDKACIQAVFTVK